MRPPMRAHWCHLANMIELVHPSAHSSPQPKRKIDQFSRFCIAHGRKCLYFTMGAPIQQICFFPWGNVNPIMMPWANVSPQHKRHLDWFSRVCTHDHRVSVYFTMVRLFPLQNCPFPWGIWTPCNTWLLGPTQVLNPNGNSITSAIFAGLTSVTDRQADRPCYLVGNKSLIGRMYVRSNIA